MFQTPVRPAVIRDPLPRSRLSSRGVLAARRMEPTPGPPGPLAVPVERANGAGSTRTRREQTAVDWAPETKLLALLETAHPLDGPRARPDRPSIPSAGSRTRWTALVPSKDIYEATRLDESRTPCASSVGDEAAGRPEDEEGRLAGDRSGADNGPSNRAHLGGPAPSTGRSGFHHEGHEQRCFQAPRPLER